MPKFSVSVPYSIDREEAIKKLKTFMDAALEDAPVELSDVREDWDDNGDLDFAFKAMGFRVEGQMVTHAQQVTISGSLPFAALPFRSTLETQLAEKVRQAIQP